ncbi:LamG-like jellyroll fold domain-containing protein [Winogradskyella sp. A3E31]|uniref:LamG-like jellyroll fold domain-containing protein n=1 Tax=Winogradskyella sp. A3E31 TaxID=3349637 RepID=UPI00398B16A5
MKKQLFIWSALVIMSCSNDDSPTETEPVNTAPITEDVSFSVDEYLTSDLLGTIEAYDNDGDDLTFSIASQTPADAMTINETNGQLIVQTPDAFDFEQRDEVTATIEVSDGQLTTSMQLIISINDVPGPAGNLLAYYPFNNDMDDYSGNGNHVTNNSSTGITTIPNRFGKLDSAVEFNEGFMSIPSFGENATEFSISVWVYKDTSMSPGFNNAIISKAGVDRDYVLRFDGDKINAHYYRDLYYHNATPDSVPLNQWINVILTVEEENNTWSVYIDGELKISNPNAYSNNWTNNSVVIGALEEAGGEYFKGKIDDILVYDRVLNAADIYEISRNRY